MGNSMKHKRNLSENYMKHYGWQSNKLISPAYETWKGLEKEEHTRNKPKLVASAATGGFKLKHKKK
jgi:hypothetical protein